MHQKAVIRISVPQNGKEVPVANYVPELAWSNSNQKKAMHAWGRLAITAADINKAK